VNALAQMAQTLTRAHEDLPHRALMGEQERRRRTPKPRVDLRARIRESLTDDWQTLRQLMERSGCSKWLVYDELGGAVDEGCAEVCVSGDAKRTKLYRRVR